MDRGYTFIEVAIVAAIIAILASAIMPLAKITMQREREMELRRTLREVRTAINKFHDDAETLPNPKISPDDLPLTAEHYPQTLQILVDGVSANAANTAPNTPSTAGTDTAGKRLRYLRRVPIDPITHSTEWGMRSSRDDATSKSWGGQNVYDIYTKSDGRGLDGTKYSDW
jgi:general secretion pathway protein G